MMELIKYLATFNDFNAAIGVNVKKVLSPPAERFKANLITDLDIETVYIEHINFVNFTKFDLPHPIYINLVRDPVERVISWYFYIRGSYKNAIFFKKRPDAPIKSADWFKKDFNNCVRTGDPECLFEQYSVTDTDYSRQALFFCGHLENCVPFNSPWAVQIAKQNVERYYAVVGSWEDTNITLTVLEKFIPRYFRGAKTLFEIHHDKITNQNKNRRKPKIDDDVREMIRKNFTREYDFYYFCKQRLYKQYISLNLKELNNSL